FPSVPTLAALNLLTVASCEALLLCAKVLFTTAVLPYRLPLLAQTHCQDPCRLPPEHLILLPLLSAATVMNNQRLAFVVHSLTLTPATCPLTSSFGVTSVFFRSATMSYATTVRPNLPAIERILVWLPHPATLGQLGLQHGRLDTIEEVIASAPTPNRYWRMLIDPEFSPLVANPGPPIVTVEAFLGLTHQV
ncbi:hypothetical protein GW17_00053949, partial [Ensete ventricosum]